MWNIGGQCYTDQQAMDAGLLTAQQIQAYRALRAAAERIGKNNYARGGHSADPRSRNHYRPTEAHQDILDAMAGVLDGGWTPGEAMALLHRADVEDERVGHL